MTEKFYKVPQTRLEYLVYRDNLLGYMEDTGVDNWEGMEEFDLDDVQEDFEHDMERFEEIENV